MSFRYIGGLLGTAPTIVAPVDSEGGTAPGIWTRSDQARFKALGTWPMPILPKYLWSWGLNTDGQLGLGNTTVYSSPKQVGALTTWFQISGGRFYSAAVKTDGTLWTWGNNGYGGQLGLGNTTYYSSPKQVGALTTWTSVWCAAQSTFAIKGGTLWSWGQNAYGLLGLGNSTYYSSPKQIGALTTWSKITASFVSAYAIKTDGTLWSWGYNQYGQLGLNDVIVRNSPVQVGALTTWLNVAGGTYHAMAIKTDGTLWALGGNNFEGPLGLGNTTNYSSPKQVGALTTWLSVSCGRYYSLATTTLGSLYSWGNNGYGNLGLGNTTGKSSPNQVGALTTWLNVSASGYFHVLANKTDGTLWSWGNNTSGALGLGNTTNYSSPKQVGARTTWKSLSGGWQAHTLALST